MMASLANGGSADDIAPGVDFFSKLKKAGNFLPVDPTPATIESGQTPVVIDWDYLNAAQTRQAQGQDRLEGRRARQGAVGRRLLLQAINKDAPHPAAARLWEEFLYSDEGQNLWLKGGARPVRADAMVKAGTIDKAAFAALPAVNGTPVFLTQQQTRGQQDYLPRTGPSRPVTHGRARPGSPASPPRPRPSPRAGRWPRRSLAWLGALPFFVYVGVFLLWPDRHRGRRRVPRRRRPAHARRTSPARRASGYLDTFVRGRSSLSAVTAVVGAVLGALLA